MGKLAQMVWAKKEEIINVLILENVYQPADRTFLSNLPLANLEKLKSEKENKIK